MMYLFIFVFFSLFSLCLDECMKRLFQNGDGIVVKGCIKWLSSRNKHLEISGSLAIGNFGRSGKIKTSKIEKTKEICLEFFNLNFWFEGLFS